MATDYNSQMPVRSLQDGLDERVLVKIQDGDNPSGAGETVTVSEKKAHVRTHSKDSDGVDQEHLVSQEGHTLTNGDYDAVSNKRPSSQGLIASDRGDNSETGQNQRPSAVAGDDSKICLDVAISNSNGLRIDENNPLAIYMAESPAEEVDDFNDADAVGSGSSANHDYTVTAGKDLKAIVVPCQASGDARFGLAIEDGVGVGTFTEVGVCFTSSANQNATITYKKKVGAGVIVRVVKRNDDNKPQSLYSQVQGLEI